MDRYFAIFFIFVLFIAQSSERPLETETQSENKCANPQPKTLQECKTCCKLNSNDCEQKDKKNLTAQIAQENICTEATKICVNNCPKKIYIEKKLKELLRKYSIRRWN